MASKSLILNVKAKRKIFEDESQAIDVYLNQGNVHICQTSFYEDLYSQLMHAQQSSYCISIFILYTLHCIWINYYAMF